MILEPRRLLLGDWTEDFRGLKGNIRDLREMGNLCGAAGGVRVTFISSPHL